MKRTTEIGFLADSNLSSVVRLADSLDVAWLNPSDESLGYFHIVRSADESIRDKALLFKSQPIKISVYTLTSRV